MVTVTCGLAPDGESTTPPSAHSGAAKASSATIATHDAQTRFILFPLRNSLVGEYCRMMIDLVKSAMPSLVDDRLSWPITTHIARTDLEVLDRLYLADMIGIQIV